MIDNMKMNTENTESGDRWQDYSDLFLLPHKVSENHPQMSIHDRAAQFSPFAALTGFEGAIEETSRLTDDRAELEEDKKALLDEKINIIREQIKHPVEQMRQTVEQTETERIESEQREPQRIEIEVTFFCPDGKKEGGKYTTIKGFLKKLDEYDRILILESGERIPIGEITDLSGELFHSINEF